MNSTLAYNNGMVSWKPVMGAKNYEVKVNNGKATRISDGSYQAPVTFTQAGMNTISVRYYDGEAYSDWATMEVYAHEIVFDSRAGANVDTMYKANGDTIVLPETDRHGYEFGGWYNAPGGAAGNAAKFEDGIVNVTGSIALYASWTPAEVTVNFNTNMEDYTMDSVKVTYTKNFTLAVPENNNGEKFFLGWFTSINCTCINSNNTANTCCKLSFLLELICEEFLKFWAHHRTTSCTPSLRCIHNNLKRCF